MRDTELGPGTHATAVACGGVLDGHQSHPVPLATGRETLHGAQGGAVS